MNLRQIEAFQAVMKTGSITEAAKLLFITQPAVSRLISDLEYKCGMQLFERSPNRLTPTSEAQALYREVDRSFIGLEAIRRSAKAIAERQIGRVRIAAMPICVDSFLPALIARFLNSHPDVNIELEYADRSEIVELIRTQQYDLGIATMPTSDEKGLHVERIQTQKAVCALPTGHPLTRKKAISPEDLSDEAFLSLSAGSPFRVRIDELFERRGISRRIAVETRTQQTLCHLVAMGVGVAILDPLVNQMIAPDKVVLKPIKPDISWDLAALYAKSNPLPLVGQDFMALMMEYESFG